MKIIQKKKLHLELSENFELRGSLSHSRTKPKTKRGSFSCRFIWATPQLTLELRLELFFFLNTVPSFFCKECETEIEGDEYRKKVHVKLFK